MFTTITTRYAGTCGRCHESIPAGTRVRYGGRGRLWHLAADCPVKTDANDPGTFERTVRRIGADAMTRRIERESQGW